MTEPERAGSDWLLVVDPQRRTEHGDAPPDAVLGAWLLDEDGAAGPFRANPDYRPATPDSPTDPVDGAIRLVVRGEYTVADVVAVMRGAVFGIALGEDGAALVSQSPDGVPSVLVVTSTVHSRRLQVPAWQEISAKDLADSLPGDGVDILLNPGATASMRVSAAALKAAVAKSGQWVLQLDEGYENNAENNAVKNAENDVETDAGEVPPEAVVGGWWHDEDGTVSPFQANADYVPSSPDRPTDPVDAVLRLAARGASEPAELLAALEESLVLLALDEQDAVVVTDTPDGPSALVATAPAHTAGIAVATWQEVDAAELRETLPSGTGVLINAASATSARIGADELSPKESP